MKSIFLKSLFVLLGFAFVISACKKTDDSLELHSNPGNNFQDIENEGYKVTLNANPAVEGQKGTWRIYIGENGTFDDVNDANTVFHGEPGENYLLGWEVSSGDKYKSSSISVSFKKMSPELDMVIKDTIYDNISLYLNAKAPMYGANGFWEIIEGEGGRIENADNANAEFIGIENQKYKLRWNLTYGSKNENIEFSFQSDTLRANAGIDMLDIITADIDTKYSNLNAFLPAGGVGSWEIISQGEAKVYSPSDPTSIISGVADSVYTLIWKVNVDDYQSVDTLGVRFRGKWGVFTDTRDGKNYRFVEIDGRRWMADNFDHNGAFTEYGRSWYYGQSSRAFIDSGHALETKEDRKFYGRLYNYFAAIELAPEGWRLPKREEFEDLEKFLGGSFYAYDKMIIGGESGIELNFSGSASYSNGSVVNRDYYSGQDEMGLYWLEEPNYNRWQSLGFAFYEGSTNTGVAPLSMYFSGATVRYVQDIE